VSITTQSFSIMLEPQEGGTYDEMAALARRAEALGFGGFFRSDHYHPMTVPITSDASDAWAVLAGLARDTKSIRLGTMVSPMTFRHPSEFAKVVATVDQMSGGRIEVGMGAGWFEKEHVAYGLPFPDAKGRIDRLEESLEVCTRLWGDGPATFQGKLFSLKDAPGHPKPVQRPHPPIIIGGGGRRRTPALAARFANEFNVFGGGKEQFAERRQRVIDACGRIGRDPKSIVWSWAGPTIVGTDDQDLRRRSQFRLDYNGQSDEVSGWIEGMRSHGMFIGTVDQVVAQIKDLASLGCSRWYFQLVPVDDDGMLEILANEVAPRVALSPPRVILRRP
jgi:F420-dependent oxidoreductase-like protein